MKPKLIVSLILIFAALFVAAQWASEWHIRSDKQVTVTTSMYPLADFATHVGGNSVIVTNITPPGAEPHDYEPTPQDVVRIRNSWAFLFNGNGIDPWAEKLKDDLIKNGVVVVNESSGIKSLPPSSDEGSTGKFDPHYWLDPVIAQAEVKNIAQVMSQVDPLHANEYQANAERYNAELATLDSDYKTGLANCALHDIVTSHASFSYLAKRYNFNQIALAGLSPDEEPSPKRLAEIADLVKGKHLTTIFFETLVSPKLAETLAQETGAHAAVLNPIEGLTSGEIKQGKDYISMSRENLAQLKQAMQCP